MKENKKGTLQNIKSAILLILIIGMLTLIICMVFINKYDNESVSNNNSQIGEDNNTEKEDEKKENLISMNDYKMPLPSSVTERKILKVLIIEIDPIMTKGTILGENCTGKTASSCLKQDKQKVINELIEDIEYSSHNIIDVQIVDTYKMNEFSTNQTTSTLVNGTKANKLDEETWLHIMKNGWYGFWDNKIVKEFGSYVFDYEYLINKANLVERRNNNEFDEVWLVNVDPIATYESVMVGKTAYWINGEPIIKNCENFRIMNVSISRPDTNFECNGHAAENIMSKVFNTTTSYYSHNEVYIDDSNYLKLNLWEKFILNENANSLKGTGLNGPGNIHFSPNSKTDYDWSNFNDKVISKWKEWENYPNLTNKPGKEIFSPNVYLNNVLNGTQDTARKHHRWWFRLMPHVTGYTTDGYSNNWWNYLYSSDYVTKISTSINNYTYNVNDYVNNIIIQNLYWSGRVENIVLTEYSNNMNFSNKSIFSIDEKGHIIATSKGTSTLNYYRDGNYVTINIKII